MFPSHLQCIKILTLHIYTSMLHIWNICLGWNISSTNVSSNSTWNSNLDAYKTSLHNEITYPKKESLHNEIAWMATHLLP